MKKNQEQEKKKGKHFIMYESRLYFTFQKAIFSSGVS